MGGKPGRRVTTATWCERQARSFSNHAQCFNASSRPSGSARHGRWLGSRSDQAFPPVVVRAWLVTLEGRRGVQVEGGQSGVAATAGVRAVFRRSSACRAPAKTCCAHATGQRRTQYLEDRCRSATPARRWTEDKGAGWGCMVAQRTGDAAQSGGVDLRPRWLGDAAETARARRPARRSCQHAQYEWMRRRYCRCTGGECPHALRPHIQYRTAHMAGRMARWSGGLALGCAIDGRQQQATTIWLNRGAALSADALLSHWFWLDARPLIRPSAQNEGNGSMPVAKHPPQDPHHHRPLTSARHHRPVQSISPCRVVSSPYRLRAGRAPTRGVKGVSSSTCCRAPVWPSIAVPAIQPPPVRRPSIAQQCNPPRPPPATLTL